MVKRVFSLLVCLGMAISTVRAQPILSRQLRIVSAFAAGSVSDSGLRIFAEELGRRGITVIIENMPQGGGTNAALAVKNAPADGHTLALMSSATAIAVSLFEKLPYSPVVDFVPVSLFSTFDNVFAVRSDAPYYTFKDFLFAVKANPGALNIGTTTPGSANYLAVVLLKSLSGGELVTVPHRTPSELVAAILRRDVHMIVQPYGALRGAIESGHIRPLATAGARRAGYLPTIPTVAEAGVPGFELSSWNALFMRSGTRPEEVATMQRLVTESLSAPMVRERFLRLGLETSPGSSEQLRELLNKEIERYAVLINRAGVAKQ